MINKKDYELINYGVIERTEVKWLWYPYIPFGKITILQGDPGEGKTSLMIKIAAMVTKGESIPDGRSKQEPASVIFQNDEDGKADTMKPRFDHAEADCSRVSFIKTDTEKLSLGDERFEQAIQETNAKLLVIDPIQAFLNKDQDIHKAGKLRDGLKKLSETAEKTGCAVVLIGHLNKANGGKGIYRGLGSIDVAAVARSILLIGRDQMDPDLRIMVPVKSSLTPEGCAYAFRLDPKKGLIMAGKCGYTVDQLLGNTPSPESKIEKAKSSLKAILKGEDVLCSDIILQMERLGISKRTVEKAKADLEIESYRKGGAWYWHMSEGA